MGSILQYFNDWKRSDVKVYGTDETFVEGEADESDGLLATIKAVFYEGRSAEAIISERFRADIVGVLVIEPADLVNGAGAPITIVDGARIDVGSIKYSSVHLDDIMGLGEVDVVGLKAYT